LAEVPQCNLKNPKNSMKSNVRRLAVVRFHFGKTAAPAAAFFA
jgi:hypothetical protein